MIRVVFTLLALVTAGTALTADQGPSACRTSLAVHWARSAAARALGAPKSVLARPGDLHLLLARKSQLGLEPLPRRELRRLAKRALGEIHQTGDTTVDLGEFLLHVEALRVRDPAQAQTALLDGLEALREMRDGLFGLYDHARILGVMDQAGFAKPVRVMVEKNRNQLVRKTRWASARNTFTYVAGETSLGSCLALRGTNCVGRSKFFQALTEGLPRVRGIRFGLKSFIGHHEPVAILTLADGSKVVQHLVDGLRINKPTNDPIFHPGMYFAAFLEGRDYLQVLPGKYRFLLLSGNPSGPVNGYPGFVPPISFSLPITAIQIPKPPKAVLVAAGIVSVLYAGPVRWYASAVARSNEDLKIHFCALDSGATSAGEDHVGRAKFRFSDGKERVCSTFLTSSRWSNSQLDEINREPSWAIRYETLAKMLGSYLDSEATAKAAAGRAKATAWIEDHGPVGWTPAHLEILREGLTELDSLAADVSASFECVQVDDPGSEWWRFWKWDHRGVHCESRTPGAYAWRHQNILENRIFCDALWSSDETARRAVFEAMLLGNSPESNFKWTGIALDFCVDWVRGGARLNGAADFEIRLDPGAKLDQTRRYSRKFDRRDEATLGEQPEKDLPKVYDNVQFDPGFWQSDWGRKLRDAEKDGAASTHVTSEPSDPRAPIQATPQQVFPWFVLDPSRVAVLGVADEEASASAARDYYCAHRDELEARYAYDTVLEWFKVNCGEGAIPSTTSSPNP